MDQSAQNPVSSIFWEPDPWSAEKEVVDFQRAGFLQRAESPIVWEPLNDARSDVFNIDRGTLMRADVVSFATYAEDDLLLMQLIWHGFPDPPEWRLLTRPKGQADGKWQPWGYFADLPPLWTVPGEKR
jgi:hypothetical protein